MIRSRIVLLISLLALNGALILAVFSLQRRLQPVSEGDWQQGLPPLVARVNGEAIYARDLLSSVPLIAEKPTDSDLAAALQRLIDATVAAQAAEKSSPRQPEVTSTLDEVAAQFVDQIELQAAQRAAGLKESDLRDRFARHARTMAWLETLPFAEPTEEELHRWYETNSDAFLLPEVVEARHFAAIFPPNGTPTEVLARTDRIHQATDALKNGKSFQEVIDSLSEDPARPLTGGSLFWFSRERIDPALANAAFEFPIGEITPPIPTKYGFHLLRVSARRSATRLTFDEAREEVRIRLTDERRRKNIQNTVANLRKNAKIEIFVSHLSL